MISGVCKGLQKQAKERTVEVEVFKDDAVIASMVSAAAHEAFRAARSQD